MSTLSLTGSYGKSPQLCYDSDSIVPRNAEICTVTKSLLVKFIFCERLIHQSVKSTG
ncbi:MAG: hypothetical protein LBP67_02470 [Bacteroidales bacterium]|nr:hypothetical protein [Bacteroidales bacterium]